MDREISIAALALLRVDLSGDRLVSYHRDLVVAVRGSWLLSLCCGWMDYSVLALGDDDK